MANKNIILCSDGTGNSDTKGRGTNVFKLYEAIDIHGHKSDVTKTPQIAFYDDGVGTENFAIMRMLGAAFGWGFAKNIRDLYTELVHVYSPGDKLFLFGFSRGAYTIRALAGMIQYCGVLDRSKKKFANEAELLKAVKACWKEFEKVAFPRFMSDESRRAGKATADPHPDERWRRLGSLNQQVEIEFLGVWDTVGAVGMPIDELKWIVNMICPRKFNELTLGPHVKRACHALSIDDERRTFHPEMWNESQGAEGRLDQVWFAGVHSNIGGGYCKQGMSLVALDWMMSQAAEHKLRFIPTAREYIREHRDVHDKLYDSRSGYAIYYRWDPRNIRKICNEYGISQPKIHSSVFERIANTTDGYAPGNIPVNLKIVHTPGVPLPPQLQSVEQVVKNTLQSVDCSSLQELPDIRKWMRVGSFSYFVFLVVSLSVVYAGLTIIPPGTENMSKEVSILSNLQQLLTNPAMMLSFIKKLASEWMWLLPTIVFCWGLAKLTDDKMEMCYSNFWHEIRSQLDPWGADPVVDELDSQVKSSRQKTDIIN